MAFRELPTFYYHTHFMEFLDFVRGPSLALLNQTHLDFLARFDAFSHLEQCLVVRLINRKQALIKKSSLKFPEIPNIDDILSKLEKQGFIAQLENTEIKGDPLQHEALLSASEHNFCATYCASQILQAMTKPELVSLYNECAQMDSVAIPKSANKAAFVEHCSDLSPQQIAQSEAAQGYIVRLIDEHIDYFLFLYFGHGHGTLNQFSMRDLGIMRTRDKQAQMQSRFVDYESAYSAFTLKQAMHRFKQLSFTDAQSLVTFEQSLVKPSGPLAAEYDQSLRFKIAKALLEFAPEQSLIQLAAIQSPQAQEYWCRQAYKHGLKEQVELRLNEIIDNPLSDRLLQFAEDFLARKYYKKRTSLLTDMLRDNTHHLFIDETYKGSVEQGVIAYYQARGVQAWRSENYLWQNLFGLVFWPELFEIEGLGLATAFDYMPLCIKQNSFLTLAEAAINKRLAGIKSYKDFRLLLSKHSAKYYGQSQGMVSWHPNMLDTLLILVEHAPLEGIKQQLLTMCRDWSMYHDGYPDIMVLENNQLRFEEIKAQGDSLRRNQLMQIQSLKQFGFDVGITTVDWTLDPMQPYAVIDIETTGGRAGTHKITEIGMVKMVNGEVVDQWQSLINPERRIPSMITELTGINNEMVADAPLFVDIADELEKFTENCIFVAHNVNFDYGFIREEFARLQRSYRRPKLCTVQQMRKHFKGLPSYSLANLTRHFDIKMQRHHRALSDAVAAAELLKLVNQARLAEGAAD